MAHYKSLAEDSPELYPGLSKYALRANPDLIVVSGMDYTIRTFDPRKDYKLVQIFEAHTSKVNCVVPYKGMMLLSAADDMTIRQWKVGTTEYGDLLLTIWIDKFPVMAICPLPGHRVACGGLDKMVRILSLWTGATLHKIADHGEIGPDGNYFQVLTTAPCGFGTSTPQSVWGPTVAIMATRTT